MKHFYSKLSFKENIIRIQNTTEYTYFGEFKGKSRNNKFWIRYIDLNYSNSFVRQFHGRIVETGDGCVIVGKFRINMLIKILYILIWSMIFFLEFIIVQKLLKSEILKFSEEYNNAVMILFGGFCIILASIAVLLSGVRKGYSGELKIVNMVKTIFQASEKEN